MPEQYYPVLLAMGIAIAMGIVILSLSWILGKIAGHQHGGVLKGTTVESGMPLLDTSHKRISIAFFLIAIDFIVFDLEAAFLYPWSLILREGGWPLFAAVMVFISPSAVSTFMIASVSSTTKYGQPWLCQPVAAPGAKSQRVMPK